MLHFLKRRRFRSALEKAEKGDADAQCSLGMFYQVGKGVPKDYRKAAQWFQKAASRGHLNAQFLLSALYSAGLGVQKNEIAGANLLRKAAEQGHARSQYALGELYRNGEGVERNSAEAFKWFFKAAEQGNVDGQRALGECYFLGEENDLIQSAKWFRLAAEQGSAWAQYSLGQLYLCGLGVTQNKDEGLRWLQKAAQRGSRPAQWAIGGCFYLEGKEEAKRWYQKAAAQGYVNEKPLLVTVIHRHAEDENELLKSAAFNSLMDRAETMGFDRDALEKLKAVRKADQQRQEAVTRREVEASRLDPGDDFRRHAVEHTSAPGKGSGQKRRSWFQRLLGRQ
jgi:TPR repeat protein